jgi:hypothetical protein
MSIVLAAWTFVLALSLLPTVIAQEVLGQTVTADLKAGSSIIVIVAGLIVTMGWKPMRALRPLLLLFLVLLAILKRDRRAFYLAKGDLSAPAQPIGWLYVKPGDRWNTVGRNLAVFISLGTLAFGPYASRRDAQST